MSKTKTSEWTVIPDSKVRHIWAGYSGDKKYEAGLAPTFYEDKGVPIDNNGDDMTYVRTEIMA
jgi:hypothetical protein